MYGTEKQSNKKDWHILRNIKDKLPEGAMILPPDNRWECEFVKDGVEVHVAVRIGTDWWQYLGGSNCFMELCIALIRSCVSPGDRDSVGYEYAISDLDRIISTRTVPDEFNISILQRSQLEWLFFFARHFCDDILDT